jgi:hypothetical protein
VQDSTASLLAPSTFSSILATASGGASLNDYTTLFEQEQSRTIVDLIGESKERGFDSSIAHFYGGEDHSILVKYGATVKRGFRDNDYTKNHIGRVMGAYDLTADDKLLIDSTFTALDRGDTLLGFNPLINDPDLEIDADEFMGRLGYRHTFDSAQHLLAQVSYVDLNQNFSDDGSVRPLQVEVTNGNELLQQGEGSVPFRSRDAFGTRGFLGDMQHLLDREYFSLVSGVGFVSLRQNQSNTATDAPAEFELPSDFSLQSRSDTTPSATRGYSYATLKPAPWLSLTGGANYSSLNKAESEGAPLTGGEQNIDKLSPRVGVLLSPTSSLTVRSAYFHRIGGASARDFDNLEPTQISGIRTVFTDLPGVESENFGAGVDWKIPKSTYMGVEYLARRFNEPFTSGVDVAQFDLSGTLDTRVDPSSTRFYSGEQIVTGYLQQVITPQLVSSLEHSWSLREDDISDINVATHKTRLGLNYFHPSGFYSFGSGTWRHQTRDNFEEAGSEGVTSFWVFSAGAGWQLPNRHGAIQLAVRNIFDETFQYEQPTSDLSVLPGTDVQLALNLNF